jgi:DNA-binding response OmpR family regulator
MAKILIVDDDQNFRDLLEMLFQGNGFAVLTAEDGETGLTKTVQEKPDIVLLDIQLPGIDGYSVLERLKADPATSAIPVVICSTTFRDPSHVKKAMAMGASDYIRKPIHPQELFRRVSKWVPS